MKCTWKGCEKEGETPQLDKNGNEWALLCRDHHNELERGIDDFANGGSPKNILRLWVLASGGASEIVKDAMSTAEQTLQTKEEE